MYKYEWWAFTEMYSYTQKGKAYLYRGLAYTYMSVCGHMQYLCTPTQTYTHMHKHSWLNRRASAEEEHWDWRRTWECNTIHVTQHVTTQPTSEVVWDLSLDQKYLCHRLARLSRCLNFNPKLCTQVTQFCNALLRPKFSLSNSELLIVLQMHKTSRSTDIESHYLIWYWCFPSPFSQINLDATANLVWRNTSVYNRPILPYQMTQCFACINQYTALLSDGYLKIASILQCNLNFVLIEQDRKVTIKKSFRCHLSGLL